MPTRRFRKRGGACEDNPDDCTMVEKAANMAKAPFEVVGDMFGKSKKVAEDVVGTSMGAVSSTVGQFGSMITPSSASTPEQKGGKRRKTKRRRAKRRTRR